MKNALSAWLPVVVCTSVIWGLGGDAFSNSDTSRILEPILRWLLPDLAPETMKTLLLWIRKAMHPVEYAALAVLTWRATSMSWKLAPGAMAALALGGVAALAGADELRQSLSSLRTGSAYDSLLDIAGASVALLALHGAERALGRPLFRRHPIQRSSVERG